MKKRRKNKRTKFWYLQDFPPHRNQIPIFVGYSVKEITAIMKRQKDWNQEPVKAWEKEQKQSEEFFSKDRSGGIWFHNNAWAVMWFKDFADDWDHYECIIHESFHLIINILGRQKAMINHSNETIEEEAMAYQQEYLFRSIRRKLQHAFL